MLIVIPSSPRTRTCAWCFYFPVCIRPEIRVENPRDSCEWIIFWHKEKKHLHEPQPPPHAPGASHHQPWRFGHVLQVLGTTRSSRRGKSPFLRESQVNSHSQRLSPVQEKELLRVGMLFRTLQELAVQSTHAEPIYIEFQNCRYCLHHCHEKKGNWQSEI